MSQGWYDDPTDPSRLRYWDGQQWSQQTAPKPGAAPAPPPAAPPPNTAFDLSSQPTQVVPPRPSQPTAVYPAAGGAGGAGGGNAYQPPPGLPGAGGGAYQPYPSAPGAGAGLPPGSGYQSVAKKPSRVGLWLGVGAAAIVLLVILAAFLANRKDTGTAAGSTTTAPAAPATGSTTPATGGSATTAGATTTAPAAPSTKVAATPASAPAGGKGAQSASTTAKKIIEGTLATRLGLGTITATCEVPPNTNVGTTFACTSPTKFGTINWLATIEDGNIVDVMGQNVIPADDVPKYAAAAVDVLEKQAGQTLGIENFACPPGPIVLNASNQFVCALTDPQNRKQVYDATITVTDISEGSFVVKVADKPR